MFFISRSPFAAEVFLITVSFLCHEIDVFVGSCDFLEPIDVIAFKEHIQRYHSLFYKIISVIMLNR